MDTTDKENTDNGEGLHNVETIGQSNYQTACYKCGKISNLVMAAHRNNNKDVVGWIFVCNECLPELLGRNIEVSLSL